jgi:hypothetical protein
LGWTEYNRLFVSCLSTASKNNMGISCSGTSQIVLAIDRLGTRIQTLETTVNTLQTTVALKADLKSLRDRFEDRVTVEDEHHLVLVSKIKFIRRQIHFLLDCSVLDNEQISIHEKKVFLLQQGNRDSTDKCTAFDASKSSKSSLFNDYDDLRVMQSLPATARSELKKSALDEDGVLKQICVQKVHASLCK